MLRVSNDIREMTAEEYNALLAEIAYLSQSDPWFTFKRKGIQEDIFNAFKDNRTGYFECIVSGPNQILKSTAGQELLMDCLTRRNQYRDWSHHPKHVLIISPKQTLQASGFQKNFQQLNADFMKENLVRRPSMKGSTGAWAGMDFKNGDHVQWETIDAGVQYIESISADLIIIEEGNDAYEFYEYLTQRATARAGVIYWSMIPGSKALPVYQRIFKLEENNERFPFRKVIKANRSHYEAIHGKERTRFYEKTLSRRLYQIKICGDWIGAESLVYANFDLDKHVIKPFPIPSTWRRDISIDWASSNNEGVDERKQSKTAASFFAIPPAGEKIFLSNGRQVMSNDFEPIVIQYREYSHTKRRTGREHAKEISKLFDPDEKFQEIIIDCSIEDQIFQEFRQVFFDKGQGYRTYKATNKKRYSSDRVRHLLGHDLVETYFDTNRFFIFDTCQETIQETLQYEMDTKTQEPQEFADHFQDNRRYYLNRYPRYKNPQYLTESEPIVDFRMKSNSGNSELSYLQSRQEVYGTKWR